MSKFQAFIAICCLFLLTACSPKFDWREVRMNDAPISLLMPGKPASHAKEVNLNGIKVKMQMTAVDVNQISFALAYAKLDMLDSKLNQEQISQLQQQALDAMKQGMLNNIQGKLIENNTAALPKNTVAALGKTHNGQAVKLIGRFTIQGPWLIQAIMIGEEKSFKPEVVDMFFDSLKFN
ncbi:hypothetical protein [Undibacterium danionis]|uniref:Lipoprotein n=1 Tax=Undibacterium danionis TaxID=1812100 RepID=A0ABV6IFG5_9BURK